MDHLKERPSKPLDEIDDMLSEFTVLSADDLLGEAPRPAPVPEPEAVDKREEPAEPERVPPEAPAPAPEAFTASAAPEEVPAPVEEPAPVRRRREKPGAVPPKVVVDKSREAEAPVQEPAPPRRMRMWRR